MNSYTGTYRYTDATVGTTAGLVDFANSIFDAFTGCGMLRVDTTDYTGQAGRFVVAITGTGDETVVSAVSNGNTLLKGYNVYKHPTLDIYVKVEIYESGYSGISRCFFDRQIIATRLNGLGGFAGNTIENNNSFYINGTTTWSSINSAFLRDYGYQALYSYCDERCFWICGVGSARSQNVAGRLGTVVPYFYATPLYVGKAINADIYMVSGAPDLIALVESSRSIISFQGQTSADVNASLGSNAKISTITGTGEVVNYGSNAIGYSCIPMPKSFFLDSAYRVIRFSLVRGGGRIYFDFAVSPYMSSLDNNDISLDIHGSGEKNYRMLSGFYSYAPLIPYNTSGTAATAEGDLYIWAALMPFNN